MEEYIQLEPDDRDQERWERGASKQHCESCDNFNPCPGENCCGGGCSHYGDFTSGDAKAEPDCYENFGGF